MSYTIICGDARKLPPMCSDVLITDPVWPNAPSHMFNLDCSPFELLKTVLVKFTVKRIAIVMRLDSDPRFLNAVSDKYPFFRVVNLPYIMPGYIGRKLGGMEYAYLFGSPPKSVDGKRVIPGEAQKAKFNTDKRHPCPRNIKHMEWLVNWWSEPGEEVIDPFMGSGTTGVACLKQGRSFFGCEINEEYFSIAQENLENEASQQRLNIYELKEVNP